MFGGWARERRPRSFYRVNQGGFIRAGKSADNNVRVRQPCTALCGDHCVEWSRPAVCSATSLILAGVVQHIMLMLMHSAMELYSVRSIYYTLYCFLLLGHSVLLHPAQHYSFCMLFVLHAAVYVEYTLYCFVLLNFILFCSAGVVGPLRHAAACKQKRDLDTGRD